MEAAQAVAATSGEYICGFFRVICIQRNSNILFFDLESVCFYLHSGPHGLNNLLHASMRCGGCGAKVSAYAIYSFRFSSGMIHYLYYNKYFDCFN